MQELNRRNTETVEQVLKVVKEQINSMQIQMTGFQNSLSTMSERQTQLEQMLFQMKIKSAGSGPSEG